MGGGGEGRQEKEESEAGKKRKSARGKGREPVKALCWKVVKFSHQSHHRKHCFSCQYLIRSPQRNLPNDNQYSSQRSSV